MLNQLLKNRKFKKIIQNFLKKENVLDVILFGSVVRGKQEPGDVDLVVVYLSKISNEDNYEFRKKFEEAGFKIHLIGKTYETLFSSGFLARESILLEGYSLRMHDFLSSLFGFSSVVLFRYSLKGMSNSERMKFYYSLYGRNKEKGVLEEFSSYKFSERVIVSRIESVDEMKEFFEKKKIKFDEFEVLLPERISKKKILESR